MILSRISFIVLIELIYLTSTILSKGPDINCIEFANPLNRYESKHVECPTIKSSTLDKRASGNMFAVNFTCSISDQQLCSKVQNVFNKAGDYITSTINLKSTINVDAMFVDFCQQMGNCDTTEIILGAARPSRMLPFQDSDGKLRFYPQALFKQMDVNEHPAFGPSDIQAVFNSNMKYWFEGDPLPMPPNEVDMLYVVLHELVHGLGFTNSWNDYANIQALTPAVGTSTSGSAPPQFFEFVFDRSLILLPSGQPLTSITDELNQFKSNSANPDDFFNSFAASPQFSIAKDMYQKAVTHGTIGFLLNSNIKPNTQLTPDQISKDVFVLETSLNPFEPSSSIGHVDLQTYLNSSDFLMMFTYPPGETLDDMMSRAGSASTTGPIGPQLRRLLGIMGYDVNGNGKPPSSSASSHAFNLLILSACILLTFISNYF